MHGSGQRIHGSVQRLELDKLSKVALLARSRQNEAAGRLQEGRQQLARSSSQLTQLEAFKAEYEARREQAAQNGMAARQLQDYRRFLANLDAAIDRQGGEVSRDAEALQASREDLLDRSVRRESLELLIARGQKLLLLDQERREQRDHDERSARDHYQRD
jgi:flagellar FliJ protein